MSYRITEACIVCGVCQVGSAAEPLRRGEDRCLIGAGRRRERGTCLEA